MKARHLFLTIITLFLIALIATNVIAIMQIKSQFRTSQTPPPPPEEPTYGVRQIILSIYENGGVQYFLTEVINDPDLAFLGISEVDVQYNVLKEIWVTIKPTELIGEIFILLEGNYVNNISYVDYVTNIKNNLVGKLTNIGISLSEETSESIYLQDTNVSFFFWSYQYTGSHAPFQKLYQFSYDASNSSFMEYIKLNDLWDVQTYSLVYYRKSLDKPFTEYIILDAKQDNIFTGNETHTFSFKSITGVNQLQITEGSDATIVIGLPTDAVIDEESIDVGGARHIIVDNLIIVTISPGTDINDITFNFDFAFPPPSEGGDETQPPPEGGGEQPDMGRFLSDYGIYIAIGAIAIVAIAVVAKKLFS